MRPIRMAECEQPAVSHVGEGAEHWSIPVLLMGMQNSIATLETSITAALYKIKHALTIRSSDHTPRLVPKRNANIRPYKD